MLTKGELHHRGGHRDATALAPFSSSRRWRGGPLCAPEPCPPSGWRHQSSSFSVIVVLPASGCEMITEVRLPLARCRSRSSLLLHRRTDSEPGGRRLAQSVRTWGSRTQICHAALLRTGARAALFRAVVLAPVGAIALVVVHAAVIEVDGEVAGVAAGVFPLEKSLRSIDPLRCASARSGCFDVSALAACRRFRWTPQSRRWRRCGARSAFSVPADVGKLNRPFDCWRCGRACR